MFFFASKLEKNQSRTNLSRRTGDNFRSIMTVEQSAPETREFQAEVRQVLNLMINSLYSNKEIFLRELVSNASDACDKLRFEAVSNADLYGGETDLEIRVWADEQASTLTIADTGIGMTRDELVANIGTIASSGTKKFLEALSGDQKKDANLIGQFGVGFYSAFIVADKVTVISRAAGQASNEATRWESDGQGEYTLAEAEKASRGTEVILHLPEDESEFLQNYRLRSVLARYSDHISFPIFIPKPPEPAGDEAEGEAEDNVEEVVEVEWEKANQASALWTRPKNEIDDEDYQSFYKHVSHDFNEAAHWSHNRVEGNQSYTTLLYIPQKAPFDFLQNREERTGLKLYVRRVFIMDAAEQLVPNYLRFVKGVVDSDDLPLNVSRELLQENPLVNKIRSGIVKRVLDQLTKMAKADDDSYATFWSEFGEVLKEGPVEDFSNREKLLELMRFASTHGDTGAQSASLADYVGRMSGDQSKIYYVTADSYAAAKNSPHLEVFRKRGIEVLLMYDRVDEWMMGHLQEYEGKPFQSIAKGDLDLGEDETEEEKQERKKVEEEAQGLVKRLKESLGEEVKEVRISSRLTDSPACLVLEDHEMAMHMQRLFKQAGQAMPGSKPILEINATHPLIERLEKEEDADQFGSFAKVILDQAILSEGGALDDPAGFVKRLNDLMVSLAS